MKLISSILTIASSVILLFTFLFPIWNIDLHAPQYPEGLGLRIWIYQITGQKEGDLELINNLNHYIGMKEIQPESIPELQYMPNIILFFAVSGLVIGLINRKWLKVIWLCLLLITLTYGLYDYYQWGYDYGHDLNPNAPIKVPGMTYQPPLIGSKQLLNMRAESLPGIGSYVIALSMIMIMISIYLDSKKRMKK